MQTKIYIIKPSGQLAEQNFDLPEKPGLAHINEILDPIFNNVWTEHVSVLFDQRFIDHPLGIQTDMFVDEEGLRKKLELNHTATAIYWANSIQQHGQQKVKQMFARGEIGAIVGTAVVFSRRVWW